MATTSSILADASTPMTTRRASGLRKIHMEGSEKYGDYEGEYDPDTGLIWSGDEEGGEWVSPPAVGTEKVVNGVLSVWTGSGWVAKGDVPEPDAPIGTIPWLMLLLAAAGYGYYVAKRKQTTK